MTDEKLIAILQNIDRRIAAIADGMDVMNEQLLIIGFHTGAMRPDKERVPCLTLVKEPGVSQ